VKQSRPDISISVKEISKVAVCATEAHYKALLRRVKHVIDTEHHGLLLQPKMKNEGINFDGISDSEYAGDPDSRISVHGYVLNFCGAPIAWMSKAGKCVTLSFTEAE
jgi:hypothetical protein